MEKTTKSPIHFRMKIGTIEIEMACQEEQLQPAIDKILEAIIQRMQSPLTYPSDERKEMQSRRETCKGELRKLWEHAWFSSARYVNEVHVELAKRGFHYHSSAVSHALTDLVREGMLAREGMPRRYRYAQRGSHS
jgi:hypothetical protein